MPDARRYIASLTGMRGLAAFMVFLFQYGALHPGIRLDLAVPLIGNMLQFPLGFGFAGLPHWVTFPLAVTAVSSASYYLVERPFYRLKSYRQIKGG